MRAKSLILVLGLLFAALAVFGQVGNGVITGIVTDPAGSVIAGAKVEAKNSETGVVYAGASTNTGNFTIPDLPIGNYTLTVTVMGFKTYTHTNMQVDNAATVRQDVPMTVGAIAEQVTVSAESTLLHTESADLTTNFTLSQLDDLPIFGIGTTNSGTSGYRNPYNTLLTMPGVTGFATGAAFGLTVNGISAPQSVIMEGQDATDRTFGGVIYYQIGQPSVDSIQEMSYQVSNYAPEFGQAGSTAINFNFKSGTNKYHGSGYDNFVNEDLNAGEPFSTTGCIAPLANTFATQKVPTCYANGGSGGKVRPRNRRNDFGGTLGGPVYIPHIYNGHNKTFFFWSYEEYLETTGLPFSDTVPAAAYLNGDFSAISPNGSLPGTCSLCNQLAIQTTALGTPTIQKDALGNTFLANTIYDPSTRGVVASTGLGYALPFANNQIPVARFDPLYVKLQGLINSLGAVAQNTALTGNYAAFIQSHRYSAIPSIKIDHNLDAKDKLSFYYSENNTQSQYSTPLGNADGLPPEIGQYRGTFIPTYTYRLNYDRTLTPTLLLHMGVGYYKDNFDDHAPYLSFNPATYGLSGFVDTRGNFPYISGMSNGYGGMQPIGTSGGIQSTTYGYKPTATTNATWIHGKHTYKIGADVQFNGSIPENHPVVTMTTAANATEEPFTPGGSLGTFGTGNSYASWMLGDYIATNQPAPTEPHYGSQAWDIYVQDSWKITRKLTLDYGLRWDLETPQHEEYGRLGQFSETTPNQLAGGHPGSTIFASTCGCSFYQKSYPYGIGPRVGIAYQINSKTVFRGGWGVTYPYTVNAAGGLVATNGTYTIVPPPQAAVNLFVNEQTPGFIVPATWPVTSNIWPILGTAGVFGQTPTFPDANENRPPRIQQFSLGFQREITRSFVLEASYVGNRAVWLGGFLGYLDSSNHTPWASLAALGIDPLPGQAPAGYSFAPTGVSCTAGTDCARAILSQAISTTAVIQTLSKAGITQIAPYNCPGTANFNCFPSSSTISSILRPFPQYGGIAPGPSPTGNSKYDSLQIKATKRFSHGLTANGFFTWAQGFTRAVRQDFYNPQSTENTLMGIPPRTLNINFQYVTPRVEYLNKVKFVNQIIKDWQISGTGNYQSAGFLGIPGTPNSEELGTQDVYNGAPLYLDKNGNPTTQTPLNNPKSINTQQQVLNPAAWTLCPADTNCGNSGNDFLKNFRGVRHPSENAGIGRNFRIKERMNLQFRGDFINIFNRIAFPSPSTTSPQIAISHNVLGYTSGGFGTMPTYQAPGSSAFTGRTGTLVMRFTF